MGFMSTPQPPPGNSSSNPDASYRAILEYLTKRGHHKAALALTQDLGGGGDSPNSNSNPASPQPQQPGGGGKSVGLEDFAERNAPSRGTPQPRRRPDQSVAPGQMLADPPSWEKGYNGLRQFVENVKFPPSTPTLPLSHSPFYLQRESVQSLDIHRPELHPLLLPLFVHSYLDLVLVNYRDAADHFFQRQVSLSLHSLHFPHYSS